MDLLFKYWLEDCGEVLSTYSNVNDEGFAHKKHVGISPRISAE